MSLPEILLEKIDCSSLKSIQKANLKLGKLNLIVGANNTGKTTFLNSLYEICRNFGSENIQTLTYSLNNDYKMELVFRNTKTLDRYILSLPDISKSSNITELYNFSSLINNVKFIKPAVFFSEQNSECIVTKEEVLRLHDDVGIFPRQVLGYLKKYNNESFRKFIDFLDKKLRIKIMFKGAFGKPSEILYKEENEKNFLEINCIGAGTKKIIIILLTALLSPSFLFIDELENSLHPNFINNLLDFIARNTKSQIIICTHSFTLTNYLIKHYSRETKFFIFKKKINEGGNRVKSISARMLLKGKGASLKLYTELGLDLTDLFFYNGIIFVEGKDDVIFFRSVFNQLISNWDSKNITFRELGGSWIVEKQSEKDELFSSSASQVIYPIPFYHILDNDFNLNENKKPNVSFLKRHSIENYLCDLEYLSFLFNDISLVSAPIYEFLKEELLMQTIFRYFYKNLGFSHIFKNSKKINNFGTNFILSIINSNLASGISIEYLLKKFKLNQTSIEVVKNQFILNLSAYITSRFNSKKYLNYPKLLKKLQEILKSIQSDSRNILLYARGHDIENELFKKIRYDKPTDKTKLSRSDYLSRFGYFINHELHNNHNIKIEIKTIVSEVVEFFNNQTV